MQFQLENLYRLPRETMGHTAMDSKHPSCNGPSQHARMPMLVRMFWFRSGSFLHDARPSECPVQYATAPTLPCDGSKVLTAVLIQTCQTGSANEGSCWWVS